MNNALLIIAVIVRILVNPVSNVFQKQLTTKQHPLFVNLFTYALLAIVSIFIVAGRDLSQLDQSFWTYSILGGIAGALGNGFIIRALETGDLSVLGPVNAYKSIIGLIFAFILIGEIPNGWGFAGIIMIILGSYFVLNTMPEKFSWALLKQPAIQYRLAALVLTGIQAVFDKKIIQHSDLIIAFCSWSIFGFIFSIIFFFLNKVRFNTEWKKVNGSSLIKYLTLALSVGIMTMSTNYAFKNMPVAEALALFQLSILVSVYFGYKIFKEQDILKKLFGSVIMLIGSLMIILLK
jgi:uncharacterized membrane protein